MKLSIIVCLSLLACGGTAEPLDAAADVLEDAASDAAPDVAPSSSVSCNMPDGLIACGDAGAFVCFPPAANVAYSCAAVGCAVGWSCTPAANVDGGRGLCE